MRNSAKIKIINFMPHEPAYHFAPDQKPDVYWKKPNGEWVGFWTREWPNLLGEAVLKITDRYEWEVWQPDYRADRIYSKTLHTGVTHFLFPATLKTYRLGLRFENGIFSQQMITHLEELEQVPLVLQLHGFRVPFYGELLKRFGPGNKIPIFLIGHGMSKSPISELLGLHRPLTYVCLIVEQWRLRRLLRYVDVISGQAESALRDIKRVYRGRVEKLTMGCDFEFWVPVHSREAKTSIRRNFSIPQEKMVFLTTGNFVPLKQLDKLIEVFSALGDRNDFFLIVAGHGDEASTKRLKSLVAPLAKRGKAILHPYVTGKHLRNLYWMSDIYVSVSTDEGSSVALMKAMACGIPILSTPVGETTERMKQHGVGRFIPTRKYDRWVETITQILDSRNLPSSIDIDLAKTTYDWSEVAKRFVTIYQELILSFTEYNK